MEVLFIDPVRGNIDMFIYVSYWLDILSGMLFIDSVRESIKMLILVSFYA